MNTATHTPTPWEARQWKSHAKTTIGRGALDSFAVIAEAGHELDAAFIVRACNAHDELVAALREIAQMQPGQPKLDLSAKVGDANAVAFDYQRIARAALMKAGAV